MTASDTLGNVSTATRTVTVTEPPGRGGEEERETATAAIPAAGGDGGRGGDDGGPGTGGEGGRGGDPGPGSGAGPAPGPGRTAADRTPPSLTGIGLTRTRLSLRLSEAAQVTATIEALPQRPAARPQGDRLHAHGEAELRREGRAGRACACGGRSPPVATASASRRDAAGNRTRTSWRATLR